MLVQREKRAINLRDGILNKAGVQKSERDAKKKTLIPQWTNVPYNIQQRSVMCSNTTWETLTDPGPTERQAWNGVY